MNNGEQSRRCYFRLPNPRGPMIDPSNIITFTKHGEKTDAINWTCVIGLSRTICALIHNNVTVIISFDA